MEQPPHYFNVLFIQHNQFNQYALSHVHLCPSPPPSASSNCSHTEILSNYSMSVCSPLSGFGLRYPRFIALCPMLITSSNYFGSLFCFSFSVILSCFLYTSSIAQSPPSSSPSPSPSPSPSTSISTTSSSSSSMLSSTNPSSTRLMRSCVGVL